MWLLLVHFISTFHALFFLLFILFLVFITSTTQTNFSSPSTHFPINPPLHQSLAHLCPLSSVHAILVLHGHLAQDNPDIPVATVWPVDVSTHAQRPTLYSKLLQIKTCCLKGQTLHQRLAFYAWCWEILPPWNLFPTIFDRKGNNRNPRNYLPFHHEVWCWYQEGPTQKLCV